MSNEKTAFLEMFPCCEELKDICGGLKNAVVTSVTVNRERLEMELGAYFGCRPAPTELKLIEQQLVQEFGLGAVNIAAEYPAPTPTPRADKPVKGRKAAEGSVLLGKPIKGKPIEIGTVSMESGTVVVQGEIFELDSRVTKKGDSVILKFSITDYTGSIRVTKFVREPSEKASAAKIKLGMMVAVRGHVGYNRYDEDITLEPTSIVLLKKTPRIDMATEKRVELHLHTRFSALDALTDPTQAVELAASWGHPAIAVTDHGVAQAFPEIWKAGKKNGIKVIFGIEGYYINDIEDRRAVNKPTELPLDCEFVAFDIETTGLDANSERMTEIGAVIFRNGQMGERFQTFVNPEKPIPQSITELTGIRDRDVFDAPSESEAMHKFIEFAGNRPLVAHNAPFDVGFMESACERHGIGFAPVYVDTLILAQSLLQDIKRHKLDIVAARLGLPEFNHHRAVDDAVVVARMLERFIPMLKENGAARLADIDETCRVLRGGADRRNRSKHIILLVRNKTGLKNLYTLISKAHLENFYKYPLIPKSLLMQYREGLIIGSACESGEVFDAVVRGRSEPELTRIAEFYDYLEIQPICNNSFLIANGTASGEEQLRSYNRRIVELARKLSLPCVATGDVHFLEPEHEIYRKILLAAKKFADADKELPIYFKTTDEMLEEFSYLGDALCHEVVIDNSRAIADMCEEIELFPKQLFTPTIENSAEDLDRLVHEKMYELYSENPPKIVRERVEIELRDIISCKYDVIYMSAQKLVANSLEAGYLVGSRGSVGSSLVAYMAGITEVNSLPAHYRCACGYSDFESGKGYGCGADMPDGTCPVCGEKLLKDGFDIPFETFLGFGGDKVPDIDLNFSGEYQARAHKYTEELFGGDHVFRAGTIGTLAEKTAFGYVKNYLTERDMTVTKAEENRLALGLVGVKRTTGQHPGGLVIIPQDMDVTDFCPVQHPADDKESGIVTTHFEYHSMEDNLLKLDELGHDDPTMIKMLEDLTRVDAKNVPLDDAETMKIFKSPAPLGLTDEDPIIGTTGTIGIPEFGTAFTRGMLFDTRPTEFDTLVRLSGFSHGTDVWLGNAKDLILSGKVDIRQTIGCRDDIMLYLIEQGMEEKHAFKIMEAVRKGRGVTDSEAEIMRSLNVPEWYIESCRKIKYLFPKAHAVAYVMMAFRIAWFKVHEPLAFYAAYFYRRSQKDSFDAMYMTRGINVVKAKLMEIRKNPKPTAKEEDLYTTLEAAYEFYRRGFSFDCVDLYESDATLFVVTENGLRAPFVAISGLGETAAFDLVRAREGGRQFISVEELLADCPKVSQTHGEQLKQLGALGDMPETSQMSLF